MIYLVDRDGRIEACETEASAVRAESRGFERISHELYMAYWRRKDRRAAARARAPAPIASQARAVGEKWCAPWVLRDIPKKRNEG